MDWYYVQRDGSPDSWGSYHVIDKRRGCNNYVALVYDAEMAQKIADLLNAEPLINELVDAANALPTELEALLK